jgi:hypothetical protein
MSELYNTTVQVLDSKWNVSAPADHYVVGTVRERVWLVPVGFLFSIVDKGFGMASAVP